MIQSALHAEWTMDTPVSIGAGVLRALFADFLKQVGLLKQASTISFSQPAKQKTTTNEIDQAEIELAIQGDHDAFSRLIDRHQQWVAARMWKFTNDKNSHEELVHDVFVEAFYLPYQISCRRTIPCLVDNNRHTVRIPVLERTRPKQKMEHQFTRST